MKTIAQMQAKYKNLKAIFTRYAQTNWWKMYKYIGEEVNATEIEYLYVLLKRDIGETFFNGLQAKYRTEMKNA